MSYTNIDHTAELHAAGVHVNCASSDCMTVGRVESGHRHDFDGPLVCGCEEEAY